MGRTQSNEQRLAALVEETLKLRANAKQRLARSREELLAHCEYEYEAARCIEEIITELKVPREDLAEKLGVSVRWVNYRLAWARAMNTEENLQFLKALFDNGVYTTGGSASRIASDIAAAGLKWPEVFQAIRASGLKIQVETVAAACRSLTNVTATRKEQKAYEARAILRNVTALRSRVGCDAKRRKLNAIFNDPRWGDSLKEELRQLVLELQGLIASQD